MLNNENSCSLHIEYTGGDAHHYVCFKDGQGARQKIKVAYTVYLEFVEFSKVTHKQQRSNERHIEYSELTEDALYRRAIKRPSSVEDTTSNNLRIKTLHTATNNLPETQRRRFILYYEFGLTYEQIAKKEDCSPVP